MRLLTSFTVLADKAWLVRARVRMILKIFITYSSVFAIGISVALAFCNISVYQYHYIVSE